MKKNAKLSIFLLVVNFTYLFASCGQNDGSDPDKNFLNMLDTQDVNKSISLATIPEFPPTQRSIILLLLKNNSSSTIEFPYNYNIQVFWYDNDKWVELRDLQNYGSTEDNYLLPGRVMLEALQIYLYYPRRTC